ncbi:hypothetical protein BGW80DRAFT_1161662 [Lactifluus volemus]|nr:hypothetical protein BGW80DRAFT_1161662 [Lactifluus volemus]
MAGDRRKGLTVTKHALPERVGVKCDACGRAGYQCLLSLGLLQGYSALRHPRLLSFPSQLGFLQVHHFVLSSILLNPHLSQFPPSHTYQLSFWKWIIEHLELLLGDEARAIKSFTFTNLSVSLTQEDAEIDQRLYDRLISLVATSKPVAHNTAIPPPPSFVTHYWRASPSADIIPSMEGHSVTLFESRTTIESGTTGLRTWRASFVLAQYLIANPTLLINKSVLELGSGTGFLGLIVADIQVNGSGTTGRDVLYLTDVNGDVLRRCHENTRLSCNASHWHKELYVKSLDWFDALAEDQVPNIRSFLDGIKPDLVLGADILYHPDMIAPFLSTLNIALQTPSSSASGTAYIALTVRNADL